jgi:hypothetical protein
MAIAAAEPWRADVMTWACGSTTFPAAPHAIDAGAAERSRNWIGRLLEFASQSRRSPQGASRVSHQAGRRSLSMLGGLACVVGRWNWSNGRSPLLPPLGGWEGVDEVESLVEEPLPGA